MAGRESAAVELAKQYVDQGKTISAAAELAGVAISSLRRALRRRGDPPRAPVSGAAHHSYIDGRTSARKR